MFQEVLASSDLRRQAIVIKLNAVIADRAAQRRCLSTGQAQTRCQSKTLHPLRAFSTIWAERRWMKVRCMTKNQIQTEAPATVSPAVQANVKSLTNLENLQKRKPERREPRPNVDNQCSSLQAFCTNIAPSTPL